MRRLRRNRDVARWPCGVSTASRQVGWDSPGGCRIADHLLDEGHPEGVKGTNMLLVSAMGTATAQQPVHNNHGLDHPTLC